MAYLAFDSGYAPCGFLIVRDGAHYKDELATVLIQSDWDFPRVAQACGWQLSAVTGTSRDGGPCPHDGTDGTVPCRVCGLTANDFISAAYDWLREHDGDTFEGLDEYLAVEA